MHDYLVSYNMTKKKDNPKKAGRKSVMDDITLKKLEDAFLLDCTIWEACFCAWISERTYYNRVDENPLLLQRFEELRNNPVYKARKTVIEAMEKNPELALKYLERKRKNEFSTRSEVENTFITVKEEDLED